MVLSFTPVGGKDKKLSLVPVVVAMGRSTRMCTRVPNKEGHPYWCPGVPGYPGTGYPGPQRQSVLYKTRRIPWPPLSHQCYP
eukprot:1287318-Rhodomonas_salina.1